MATFGFLFSFILPIHRLLQPIKTYLIQLLDITTNKLIIHSRNFDACKFLLKCYLIQLTLQNEHFKINH